MTEEAIREVAQALYDRANDETWCDENPSSLKSVWVDGDVDFISLAEAAIAAWNRRAGGEREAWQPIETAPKQDVIILTNGGGLYQGFWQDGFGWMTGHDDGVMHVRVLLQPTHWMPLPAPPRAALAGQTEGERNGRAP